MNARPRRPVRRIPLVVVVIVLAAVAAVPALALAAVWRWASEEASPPSATTTTTVAPRPPTPRLSTELASIRRLPQPIAAEVADARGQALIDDFARTIPPSSCANVVVESLVGEANSQLAVVPASTQKLLVAAVALDVLGSAHRFATEARGVALRDGVLTGDLYLIGGGDPLLWSDDVEDDLRYPAFNTTRFDDLADQLVAAGLVRVEGDIVGDGSRYDDEFVVPTWGDTITRRDAGPYDALLVNDGRIFASGFGLNPNQSAASELNRLLVARGVQIVGRNRTADTPEGLETLATIESVPLTGVIDQLLQTSDNNTAEMLLKEIGLAGAGEGSRQAGAQVVAARLESWQIPLDGVTIDDGSGLSRANRLTCDAVVGLLEGSPVAEQLAASLPVAGRSGNLVDQFLESPVEGELRAKTGTLSDVKALSGFTPDADGRLAAFTVILNEDRADDPAVYLPVWNDVVEVIGQLPVAVDAADFAPR
jgi:serine-type D-Ala-D-Ala carboxypeptidase/endopeptidase (penicillin-binding protein 4)